jgi:hypothetical protein
VPVIPAEAGIHPAILVLYKQSSEAIQRYF